MFTNYADFVSDYAGRWPVSIFSVISVVWFALYSATHYGTNWFTSEQFNFPLNLVTTVAELFLALLTLASANRVQRHILLMLDRMDKREEHIEDLVEDLEDK